MKKIAFVQARDSVCFNLDGELKVIPVTHPQYDKILAVLENETDLDAVRPLLVSVRQYIADSSDGSITHLNGQLFFEGEPIHLSMVSRILGLNRDGQNVQPLTNFLRNVLENPSRRAQEELYGFMEHNNLPVTPDGYFIAYKMVNADFTDIYTGKMDNRPGATPKMKRADVDADKNRTCSQGLHFAGLEYVRNGGYGSSHGGNRLVAVKIHPRDVVAIPTDYNNSKGRASQYLVLRELDWDTGLPINTIGFSLYDDEPEADVPADDVPVDDVPSQVSQCTGKVVETPKTSEADIRKVKRLLAEPDSTIAGVSRATGISRRQVARIRDRLVGPNVT